MHPDGSVTRLASRAAALDLSKVALQTPDGVLLEGEAYTRHLALRFADPETRADILAQVRAEDTRSR